MGKDGFTKIPNYLLDAWNCTKMTDAERRVFGAIIRKTYGWHKEIDAISFSQVEDGVGFNYRRRIEDAIDSLERRNMIIVERKGKGRGKQNRLAIQPEIKTWETSSKIPAMTGTLEDKKKAAMTGTLEAKNREEKGRDDGMKKGRDDGLTKEKRKEKIPQKEFSLLSEEDNDAQPFKDFASSSEKKRGGEKGNPNKSHVSQSIEARMERIKAELPFRY